jgi:toxin-antitoxin system PIN domain toxin
MPLVDSNVWVALAFSGHEFHNAARAWLGSQSVRADVRFCRATQQSVLRLLTTAAVVTRYGISPLSNKAAWSTYERFGADKRIGWADEPAGLEPVWKKLASNARPSPKLWMDAYLAAFAISSGVPLVSTDQAFKQFKGLDLILLTAS